MNCEHPECGCELTGFEREGRYYCSAECAARADNPGPGDCQCGHADCD